jgi:hypothetical protein
MLDSNRWEEQEEYYKAPISSSTALGAYLYSLLCDRFLVPNASLSLRSCLGATEPHFAEKDERFRGHADRSEDFCETSAQLPAEVQQERLRKFENQLAQVRKYKNLDEFKQQVEPLASAITRIVRNGGRVVFVRFPAAGQRLQLEESAFPAATYFNAVAQLTSADWIDFRSLLHHEDFECPDGSHLSPRGARNFSESLADELVSRDLLPR